MTKNQAIFSFRIFFAAGGDGLGYTIHNPSQVPGEPGTQRELGWFVAGYMFYYVLGIAVAVKFKDNRAFCKNLCPITVFLKSGAVVSLLRVGGHQDTCTQCNRCSDACMMDIDIAAYTREGTRVKSTECTLCMQCIAICPTGSLKATVGLDVASEEKHIPYSTPC